MRLIHSECGGELEIDRGGRTEILPNGQTTDIYYPIRCIGCNAHLGMLPNVRMTSVIPINIGGRFYYDPAS